TRLVGGRLRGGVIIRQRDRARERGRQAKGAPGMNATPDDDAPLPFGISAGTGRPLDALSDAAIGAMLGAAAEPKVEAALSGRAEPATVSFAVEGGVDANDLGQAGWGILYGPSVEQKIKDALKPLIEHRRAQAKPFQLFDGDSGYVAGDT